jgi:nicotine blue oxidoreductase
MVFDARLAAEAAQTAEGDAGGRLFLEAHPELIDLVDCSTAADVRRGGDDIDLPEHLYLLDEP